MRNFLQRLSSVSLLATFALGCHPGTSAAPAEVALDPSLTLFYSQPAKAWDSGALPLGNGRLGCMVFGGVARERVQFNDSSLWTGDENPSGNYGSMGAYQNFGDLYISTGSAEDPVEVRCTSGHESYFDAEDVRFSVDGASNTKWCVEHNHKPVIWQVAMPSAAAPVTSYSLTSCLDWPTRDPRDWEFSGSDDGKIWRTLDRHEDQPPFAERGATKEFSFENTTAFRHLRFTLLKNHGAPHFQIAEITVHGFKPDSPPNTDYRRELHLASGISRVQFRQNGALHTRETLASHPDDLIVLCWTADKPGAVSGVVELKGAHGEKTTSSAGELKFAGKLDNGLAYEAVARVITRGGKAVVENGSLRLQGCDEAILLLAASTDYTLDPANNFRGTPPAKRNRTVLEQASRRSFADLRARHIQDFQSLFGRVSLDLGRTDEGIQSLPMDERLQAYAKGGSDPGMEALLFQYGRYLLMSCSRRPGLPANLQGLWNDSNDPAWHSDYHANINVQMNYWGAEVGNLGECHLPFFDLIVSQLEAWRRATGADKEYQRSSGPVRGWTLRTSHNIFGGMGWQWDKTANAWYGQHLWEHYAFSRDKEYLRTVAYPILKEVCEFWESQLKLLPDGRLVIPNGWSPEHGPHEDGVSYSQQIVWDLFNNYAQASEALGVDADYRAKIIGFRDKLLGPKIGSWGQLQEWMTDRDDPKDGHRHTSHLFGVYPGRQISMVQTPELAKAAAVSLEARGTQGDSRRSWTWPWRCALWARLGEPEKAHAMIRGLFTYNMLPNLFTTHPPFQIDGNLGYVGGVGEMLLQSHAGEIALLPALPNAWPDGKVTGLRARGDCIVDIEWKAGQVTHYRISSPTSREVKVRVNGAVKTVKTEDSD